jgi:hypothetical protein
MKRFAIATLLAAFVCAPSLGWAKTTGARTTAVGDTIARQPAVPAPVEFSRDKAADYAAREAAAPALGAFTGGGGGIYIGGSALVVVLLVVIIVILI